MESKINELTTADLINQEIVGIRHLHLPPTHVLQELRYFFQLSNKIWFEMLAYNPRATEFRIPVVDEATISKSTESEYLREFNGRTILDVLGSSCWSHFSLLIDGHLVLNQHEDSTGTSRIYATSLDSEWMADEVKSWVTGKPFPDPSSG